MVWAGCYVGNMVGDDIQMNEYSGHDVGYVRVSTADQNNALQIRAMADAGLSADQVFEETASGGSMDRPVFKRMMKLLGPGDRIVVWKLDRLGRTVPGLIATVEELRNKGVHFKSLTQPGLDTTTPMGKMMFYFFAMMAEFERDMISERTKAGMARRKAEGVKLGPPHSIKDNDLRLAWINQAHESGELYRLTARQILVKLNEADPKAKPIKAPNTYYNWFRDGAIGSSIFEEIALDGGST